MAKKDKFNHTHVGITVRDPKSLVTSPSRASAPFMYIIYY